MRKLIFAFIAIFSMTMEAQNITDAVRYSTTDLNGTARYRAMSGAFGALGGDLSSLNVNPAGSAVFLNGFATFTLNVENFDNEVSYMNGVSSNTVSSVDLGQGGAVFVFNNMGEDANWKKFSLAFNYNKSANLENDFLASGRNPNNSISDYFLNYAQGLPLDLLVPRQNETVADLYSFLGENEGFGAQQAYLGYEAFVFDAVDPDDMENTEYVSNVTAGPYDQDYTYAATGLNGKFSFNFASQYQDFLYLGMNLNTHFINYERVNSTFETNNNSGSTISEIYFEDRLTTLGNGFSLQLGAIAKLGNSLRAGLAYESPTWYNISEETTQYLETDRATVNPNVVNIYPEYKLQTPSKYTGSLAYLFGSNALLSFDYSYKDYSTTKFRPKGDPAFTDQNTLMETALKGASTFRVGGEVRLDAFSLRAGYRFEESPYSNTAIRGDLQGYSAGLGYNFGSVRLDIAYDTYSQNTTHQLYETGLTDRANIDKNASNFVLSLSFGI